MSSVPPPRHPLVREALVERRDVLRRLAVGTGAVAGAGSIGALLTGCGSPTAAPPASTPPGSAAGRGTALPAVGSGGAAATVGAYDPDRPYWLQGNFAPITTEVDALDLRVEGAIPSDLSGLFVRNGSNPATGDSPHWFLGDGMIHGIALEKGRATWYRNRYVRTPLYEKRGGMLSNGAPGMANNQSNVSCIAHAGRLFTSGEVGWPYEIDPTDLRTVGPYDFGGTLRTAMTAHPKIDPATGHMHFFGYGFVPPYLTYHVADATGALVHSTEIAVKGPTMIHDFAITEHEAVFWEMPVVFDLQEAIRGGQFPYSWDPGYGARIGILPLGADGAAIRWVEIDPCYVFHGVNAWRDGAEIVLDVCRLPSVFEAGTEDLGRNEIHRWRVDTAGAALTFRDEVVTDIQMDLPSIDRRYTGREHRFGWFANVDHDGDYGFEFAGVTQWDYATGQATTWDPGPNERAGEAVFVAADRGEGQGWLLTYAYDRTRDTSDFVVLDASDLAKGPVARVQLPQRVPYGFHGVWVPART